MQLQRVNLSTAERIFQIVYNVSGGTITANYPVCWDVQTSADGVRATKPATKNLSCLIGVATENITNSLYGKVQSYGYRSSCYITTGTSVAINQGDILIPVDAQYYLTATSAGDGKSGFVYAVGGTGTIAFATMTTPAASVACGVLIRCL